MFNPISHPVIRQALAWSNLPACHIHTLFSTDHLDGTQTALYQLTFVASEVSALWLMQGEDLAQNSQNFLRQCLVDSFCSDVQVGALWYDDSQKHIMAQLFIHLGPAQALLEGELSWLID